MAFKLIYVQSSYKYALIVLTTKSAMIEHNINEHGNYYIIEQWIFTFNFLHNHRFALSVIANKIISLSYEEHKIFCIWEITTMMSTCNPP